LLETENSDLVFPIPKQALKTAALLVKQFVSCFQDPLW